MGGNLLHVGASVICPHGAPTTISTTSARVSVGGQPVATASDLYTVTGCPFNVSGAAQPCVKIDWLAPATRVFIDGKPVILQLSNGMGVGATQAVQGPAQVVFAQARVRGI